MKDYKKELDKFTAKLKANEPFQLVRYGDGEIAFIKQIKINNKSPNYQLYPYNPTNPEHKYRAIELRAALKYQAENYFVGISTLPHVPESDYWYYREVSQQPESNLTFATLFVNSNYKYFLSEFLPAVGEAYVVCLKDAKFNPESLPFKVLGRFDVPYNAWNDDSTYNTMRKYILENKISNQKFMVCAGIAACTIIHKLAKEFPNNTFVDVGSPLDPLIGLGKTRRYLKGQATINHISIWK